MSAHFHPRPCTSVDDCCVRACVRRLMYTKSVVGVYVLIWLVTRLC